jgi:hypothetical protein
VFSPKSPGREGKQDRGEKTWVVLGQLKKLFLNVQNYFYFFSERQTFYGGK